MKPYATKRIPRTTPKQRDRLEGLAEVRQEWWKAAEESGEPIICGICHGPITRFDDLDSDHIEPGKLGGCRDDRAENLQPAHKLCNLGKGSQRNFVKGKKTVPRKPGRIMNKTEVNAYLNSKTCFCGQEKGAERPCCLECHARLAPQLKLDLSRKGAELPTFDEYVLILQEVEKTSMKGGEPCAPSGEVLPAEIGATTEVLAEDLTGGDRLIPGSRLEESA